MPQGLQVWDADGNNILDTSTFLGRIFGSIQVSEGQSAGSVSNQQFEQGEPFMTGLFDMGSFTGSILTGPTFSQVDYSYDSGNKTLNWVRKNNVNESKFPAGTLYYGVM